MPAVHVDDVTFSYPTSYSTKPLLDHITLTVSDGERACIVGPNGCGKSTLMKIVAGQIMPDAGNLTLSGSLQDPSLRAAGTTDNNKLSGSVSEFLRGALAPLQAIVDRFKTAGSCR